MKALSRHERLVRAARGQEVDRVPALGGWINGARNLAELAGISVAEYLADRAAAVVRANLALDADGMVSPIVPKDVEEVRTGHVVDEDHAGTEAEDLLKFAQGLPESEADVLRAEGFDAAAEETQLRRYFDTARRQWGGIEPIPNFWTIGGPFPLYHRFGYLAFFEACVLYPEAVGRIWWTWSLTARRRAEILVKLYRELDLGPVMFCGEDLCNNQGPMVSPQMLRQHYFPVVKAIIAPLVEAGVRLVHHCDGDVRPLVRDFLDMGFSGFQGFQYEVGVDPVELRKLRSARGEEPILLAGMSVSRTLPFGTPAEVCDEVKYLFDVTEGGRGMFLFTANVIGVEVPVANTRAGYAFVKTLDPATWRPAGRPVWPWQIQHPGT